MFKLGENTQNKIEKGKRNDLIKRKERYKGTLVLWQSKGLCLNQRGQKLSNFSKFVDAKLTHLGVDPSRHHRKLSKETLTWSHLLSDRGYFTEKHCIVGIITKTDANVCEGD